MSSSPRQMVSSCRAISGLHNQWQFISLCLNRTITNARGGSIHPTASSLVYHCGIWVSLYVRGLNCDLSIIRTFLGVHVVVRTYSCICSVVLRKKRKKRNSLYEEKTFKYPISVPEIWRVPLDTPMVTIKSFTVFESKFEIIRKCR